MRALCPNLSSGEVLLRKAQRSLSLSRHFLLGTVSSQGETAELSELEEMKCELYFWGGRGGEQASPMLKILQGLLDLRPAHPRLATSFLQLLQKKWQSHLPHPPLPCLPVSL